MKNNKLQEQHANRFIFLGVLLFLLGLVTGLLVPVLANPRMGVSSHLEGVMNGMFLIILGLIWPKLELSDKWLQITFWLSLYGTFINWFGILAAAVFDAGEMLGVAANGAKGPPLAEGIVTFCLISLSLSMLIICTTLLVGLKRGMNSKSPTQTQT